MNREGIVTLLNGIVSDFLFLDIREIDIPSAGKFLNQLEELARDAEKRRILPLKDVASGLSVILEKIILGAIRDHEAGLGAFEKGITLMQEIVGERGARGDCQRDVGEFMGIVTSLTGVTVTGDTVNAETSPSEETNTVTENEGESPVCDEALLKDFITESLEYIEEIELNILNLEQDPGDKEYINAIFRPFHSIKGVAGFLNLEQIRDLAHKLENLLDKARNEDLKITPSFIDCVLDGSDMLKEMISHLRHGTGGNGFDLTALKERMEEVEQGIEATSPKKIGEVLVENGVITEEILKESLETLQQQTSPDRLGESLIREGKATPKQVSYALRKQTEQMSDATAIRVDTTKLDDLIDMVGELVITQSMIQQDLASQMHMDRNLVRDLSQFFRITSELQRTSTSLRMIPIKQTFQRISRLVRDLAKSAGKMATVEMLGEETEIDRNMIDEIYNPLVHLVRNAVDHGLEKPEERVRKGKSEKGLIVLKASHRGGNIVIEISDDGRGMDKEQILKRAVKIGLVESGEGLSDSEIYRLVFLPGLSTAEVITDISGRGVGMDVVKQAVDKLRGKIEIESVRDKGTAFITRFPLTMAIIDGMILKVGAERYILPTNAIRRTLRPPQSCYSRVTGKKEMINVMGQLFPLVRLHDLFRIEPECRNPWEAIVMVVESDSRAKCLLVDSIMGKAEVVIKSLGDELKNIEGISGGAIMGDGQIGLILDPEGLFDLSERC